MSKPKVIALDGVAASGKSTVGSCLAEKHNYLYLDTGVMYRAITWHVLQTHTNPHNQSAVVDLCQKAKLEVVPPTQTDCPPAQTGRALVTAPLAQGKDPQVVYVPNDSSEASHIIVRYDTVTHVSTDIMKLPVGKTVKNLFLARNDQWVFFFTGPLYAPFPAPGGTLQAVRIDGQGLQTLYCNLSAPAALLSQTILSLKR